MFLYPLPVSASFQFRSVESLTFTADHIVFLIVLLEFFIDIILLAALWPWV
jgi:hypothetical protein